MTRDRRKPRRTIVLAVALVLAAGVAVWAFRPRPAAVDIAEVTRGPMTETIDEEGRTRLREPYLVAMPVTGALSRVTLDPGAPVVAGDTVLARVQPAAPAPLDARATAEAQAAVRGAEAGLRQARATLTEARAQAKLAASDLERQRPLYLAKTLSSRAFEEIRTRAAVAHAAQRAAEALVAARTADLARAHALLEPVEGAGAAETQDAIVVRAPVTGRVLRVLHKSARTLPAGTPILEVGSVEDDLEVVVPLLSADAVRVSPGDPVDLDRWGGPATIHGTVERVDPKGYTKVSALGVEEQRVDVTVRLTDPVASRAGLGDDYRVEAHIAVWSDDDALRVPSAALFREPQRALAAAPTGGGASRAVRGAALPLRHPQAVLPEEPHHPDRRHLVG